MSRNTVAAVRKNAARIESWIKASGGMATIAVLDEDVIAVTAVVTETDGVCVRKSPSFWRCLHACVKWAAISRKMGQVVGFCLGDRTRQMLQTTRDDLPTDYRNKPVKTDHLATTWRPTPSSSPPRRSNMKRVIRTAARQVVSKRGTPSQANACIRCGGNGSQDWCENRVASATAS